MASLPQQLIPGYLGSVPSKAYVEDQLNGYMPPYPLGWDGLGSRSSDTGGFVSLPTPKTYGPLPNKLPNTRSNGLTALEEAQFIEYLKSSQAGQTFKDQRYKKTALQELFEDMFTLPEKEQFLIDMGYELDYDGRDGSYSITRTLADGTKKYITNTLDDLFIREIKVKFKNLILSKSVLKLKL